MEDEKKEELSAPDSGPSVDPVPSVDCYVKVGLSANNALLGNH